jgi:maltose O-acetyltransferase
MKCRQGFAESGSLKLSIKDALLSSIQSATPATRWYKLRAALMRARGFDVSHTSRIVSSAQFVIGRLTVGNETFIGHRVNVYGAVRSGVVIGERCDIGPEVSIFAGTHDLASSHRRAGQGKATEVIIEDGCWIGGRAILVGPCRIGAGSVVAAGAVVRSDVPENSLYFGPLPNNVRALLT